MSSFKDYDPPPLRDRSTVLSRALRAQRIGAGVTLRRAAQSAGITMTELSFAEQGIEELSGDKRDYLLAFYEIARIEKRLNCIPPSGSESE